MLLILNTGFPHVLESPQKSRIFSLKYHSPGKSHWWLKVLEITLDGRGKSTWNYAS